MKKWGIVTLVALTAIVSASAASAATKLTLIVNGKVSAAETKLIDGVTYVPLRSAAELLGAEVNFDPVTNTITITGKNATTTSPASSAKSFNVDVTLQSGPMVMKISKVTLDPAYKYDDHYEPVNAVLLEMTIENTSNNTVTWYPGGEIVTDTKEQITGLTYDTMSGEYKGKVVRKGTYFYEAKGNVLDIKSLNLFVEPAYDANYNDLSEDVVTEIILE
ncbi:stalk domain-containing protein [Paenibacillus sp.]|uniref:stalk domain-containing protein n=1 Tax=Paenibacillus sp. TaxID=58172 RepID=UPI002D3E72ED|nr:stalk domain-containing protein [Paenibacillus sp.]HZG83817.1 stalk domain-containing protein [Paenibacillus sp.]